MTLTLTYVAGNKVEFSAPTGPRIEMTRTQWEAEGMPTSVYIQFLNTNRD